MFNPWSLGVFFDLLLGLILFSVLVYNIEEDKNKAIIWILVFFLSGNIGTGIYLLTNIDKINKRLSKK